MEDRREITILDSKKNRRRVIRWFYAALVFLLVVELFIPKHGHFAWEEMYGFFAVYGFIGCVALIFVAKGLRRIVKRKEDYYD